MRKNTEDNAFKALGEPVWGGLDDQAQKARKSLLLVSLLILIIELWGVHLKPGITAFGVKIVWEGDALIQYVLFLINLYFFVHFLWLAIDSFFEWRIRITGTKLAFVTTAILSSEFGDYPNNPRQSSLYCWWVQETKNIGNIGELALSWNRKLTEWEQQIKAQYETEADSITIRSACDSIGRANSQVNDLKRGVDKLTKTLESKRIPASLKRFDSWFRLFLKSQNMRWFVVDLLIPVALGGASSVLLSIDLFRDLFVQ